MDGGRRRDRGKHAIPVDDNVARYLAKPRQLLIGGEWVKAAYGKTFPTYNPATGEVLAHVAEGDKEDIDRAVAAARAAFDYGPWSKITPSERGCRPLKLADLIRKHAEDIPHPQSLPNCNPIPTAPL